MERLLCLISGMNVGGAETFLMKIYRKLDKTKYQIDFCVNVFVKCAYDDEIESYGGRIFHIPSKSDDLKSFKKQLMEIVSKNKYKNVLRITSNAAGFLDLKIAKKAGAIHTIARSSNASDGEGIKQKIAHLFGKMFWMSYVDTMVAPSELAAIYTFGRRNYSSGKVALLNNGIDKSYYKFSQKDRDEIRKRLSIADDSVVLGHMGRFSKQKNHLFLIDIFSEYHKRNANSYLLLVGTGELENAVKEKANRLGLHDYVIFSGLQSNTPGYYSAMDVFVFPSLYEGMPNTVIEAQACGRKCIISNTISRSVNITGNVVFLDIGNVDTWIDAINDIFTDEATPMDQIPEEYSIDNVVKKFVEIMY